MAKYRCAKCGFESEEAGQHCGTAMEEVREETREEQTQEASAEQESQQSQ